MQCSQCKQANQIEKEFLNRSRALSEQLGGFFPDYTIDQKFNLTHTHLVPF